MTRRALLAAAAAVPAFAERTVTIGPEGPTVEEALAKAGPGCEIVLRPGIYRGIRIGGEFAGTTIRAETKWKAVVLGAVDRGVMIEASGVTIDGLEVTGARSDGIKAAADGVTIRNCYIHNNSSMGIAIHGYKRWTIERNVIEYNGQHPQLQHGVYADGEEATIRANVVRHNAGYGLQLYPAMRGVTVVNNLINGHSTKGGIVLAAPSGRSLIANNTIVNNAYGIRLMGGSGQTIANNLIVGPTPVARDEEAGEPMLDANFTDDPVFADRSHEIYYLAAGSPAIGKASARYVPAEDFWGRPRAKGAPVDPGAFPFLPQIADPAYRKAWHNGWAYRFHFGDPKMEMPDLWIPPR